MPHGAESRANTPVETGKPLEVEPRVRYHKDEAKTHERGSRSRHNSETSCLVREVSRDWASQPGCFYLPPLVR